MTKGQNITHQDLPISYLNMCLKWRYFILHGNGLEGGLSLTCMNAY